MNFIFINRQKKGRIRLNFRVGLVGVRDLWELNKMIDVINKERKIRYKVEMR